MACSILTPLLSEYSNSDKTSNIGLSLEFHNNCKREFQEEDLHEIFVLTAEVLQEFIRKKDLNAQMFLVFQHHLALANQDFSWTFPPLNLGRPPVSVFETKRAIKATSVLVGDT